jgi:hypothetical protein
MKHRIIGLILISIGFSLPFVLKAMFPNFLYASIPAIFCFWAGFLFTLNPRGVKNDFHINLKWARYAIWVNIYLSLALTTYVQLMHHFEILNFIGYRVLKLFGFFVNPVGYIFEIFVHRSMVQKPDGSVLVTYSFVRMLLTNFFSLAVYGIAGFVLKTIKDRKIICLQWIARTMRPL